MKNYLKLLRIKHYIKNTIVFIPMFFGGKIFEWNCLKRACLGFVAFSMLASAVYIINDYRDIETDRIHPTKRYRPLASGAICKRQALLVLIILLFAIVLISCYIGDYRASLCLLVYLVLNILYSFWLKNKPIIDIVILASGFIIRMFYGGFITGIEISKWLYLVVVTGSFYMGLGKRRNEFRTQTETRDVLKYYNEAFLDKYMYVCVALVNVFYALWTVEMPNSKMIWTVPVFIILSMCYSLDIEGESDGDPVEVIVHNRLLISIAIMYILCVFAILYLL